MASDENLSAYERLEAERYRNEVVVLLAKIETEGPRIVHDTLRRLYEPPYKQQQQQQLNNGNATAAVEPSLL